MGAGAQRYRCLLSRRCCAELKQRHRPAMHQYSDNTSWAWAKTPAHLMASFSVMISGLGPDQQRQKLSSPKAAWSAKGVPGRAQGITFQGCEKNVGSCRSRRSLPRLGCPALRRGHSLTAVHRLTKLRSAARVMAKHWGIGGASHLLRPGRPESEALRGFAAAAFRQAGALPGPQHASIIRIPTSRPSG